MGLREQYLRELDKQSGVNVVLTRGVNDDKPIVVESAIPNTSLVRAKESKPKRKRKAAPRASDRHAPGYMAAYMRKRRQASANPQHVSNINELATPSR